MTKERLKEIHDSIEFQMQIQQAVGFKSRYDYLLIEQIDLYNEVIDLQEKIDKATELLKKYGIVDETGNFNAYLDTIELKELLEILKGEPNNE